MNKQLYKNNEYTQCKTEDEYNALRYLIEQDGWPVYNDHGGYRTGKTYYGINENRFMVTQIGTSSPLTETLFRGAPEWATLLVLNGEHGYVWLYNNKISSEVKYCYLKDGYRGVCKGTVYRNNRFRTAKVIAKREIKPMQTKEEMLAKIDKLEHEINSLRAQVKELEVKPIPLANLLKSNDLPELHETRVLAAWVKQEAPRWDGSNPYEVFTNNGSLGVLSSNKPRLGSVQVPEHLAKMLCEKVNSKEWKL